MKEWPNRITALLAQSSDTPPLIYPNQTIVNMFHLLIISILEQGVSASHKFFYMSLGLFEIVDLKFFVIISSHHQLVKGLSITEIRLLYNAISLVIISISFIILISLSPSSSFPPSSSSFTSSSSSTSPNHHRDDFWECFFIFCLMS
jgi:hypothetical protein